MVVVVVHTSCYSCSCSCSYSCSCSCSSSFSSSSSSSSSSYSFSSSSSSSSSTATPLSNVGYPFTSLNTPLDARCIYTNINANIDKVASKEDFYPLQLAQPQWFATQFIKRQVTLDFIT